MITKVLIIIIIGLILYVIKNLGQAQNSKNKAQSKDDKDIIDADYKDVTNDQQGS